MKELLKRYPRLCVCEESIEKAIEILYNAYVSGNKILVCGNGGSAADSEHIVGELMKSFRLKRKMSENEQENVKRLFPCDADKFISTIERAIPAISLPSQTAISSAYVNDCDPDMIYAQLTYGYGVTGDVLIALSTSGNSQNVVNAAKAARLRSMSVISLTGERECALDDLSDCIIKVPERETYKVQEYHLPVYHYICATLEEKIFKESV